MRPCRCRDHAVVGLALDFKFLEAAVDEERDALLERLELMMSSR